MTTMAKDDPLEPIAEELAMVCQQMARVYAVWGGNKNHLPADMERQTIRVLRKAYNALGNVITYCESVQGQNSHPTSETCAGVSSERTSSSGSLSLSPPSRSEWTPSFPSSSVGQNPQPATSSSDDSDRE
jgi:hypothetical protein